MKHHALIALLLTALPPLGLRAADFPAGWKHVQEVRLDQAGLVQFSVPIESLGGAQAGRRDLRFYDAAGKEIPFALTVPEAPRLDPIPQTAFKVALAGDSTIVTVTASAARPLAAVSLDTPAPQFMRAVTIEASNDGRAWAVLSRGEPFFRQFGASRFQFPLEGGGWSQVRLTFENRRAEPIPIIGATLHALNLPDASKSKPAPTEPLGVTLADPEEAGQQTRLTLRLAGANARPEGITLAADEPYFTRTATLVHREVNDNEITETVLARGTIFRVSSDDAPPKENLTLRTDGVQAPRDVILVIDNGDSPPLHITGVTARRRPVHLACLVAQPGTFHLMSGNPQAAAPRYDLAALRGQLKPALVAIPAAGVLALNPAWRAPEALADVNPVGSTIDLAPWLYRKPVTLAAAGVQQLELDLDVLSRAAKSFADLRLVRGGQQLPYLLDRTPLQRQFAPVVSRATNPKRPTTSLWELQLPQRDLPLTRLDCATTASMFQRSARVTEEHRDDRGNAFRVTLGTAEWVRTPGRTNPRLSIQLTQPPHTDRLRLEVENGDNPALDLAEFTCWHPATRVLFKADAAAETFLYYGNPAANAARYDLSLVARQILAADKTRATLGAENVLKKIRGGESSGPVGAGNWIFWAVLGVVVLVLLIVLAKLLPKPPPAS